MKKKIAIGSIVFAAVVCLFVGAASASWWHAEVFKVRQWFSVGSNTKLGKATIANHTAGDDVLHIRGASGQSGDMIEVSNSSGTKLMSVDKDGDLTAVSAVFSGATTFESLVTINDNLLVDNDTVGDVVARFDGTSGQTADLFQVYSNDCSNAEQFSLDADGDAEFSNSVLIDGGDAADEQLKVQAHASQSANIVDIETNAGVSMVTINSSGDLSCAHGLVLAPKGADPCSTLPAGSLFKSNGGSGTEGGMLCWCNEFGVDLKIDGSSADCSY